MSWNEKKIKLESRGNEASLSSKSLFMLTYDELGQRN